MAIQSFEYLIFIFITYILFLIASPGKRFYILLLASITFYFLESKIWLIWIFLVSLVSYFLSLKIEKAIKYRLILISSSIFLICSSLIIIKYFQPSFINSNSTPLGISFFSLVIIGYLVDVYRRTIPAEKNVFKYFLLVMFFPTISAGPIERAKTFLPQISSLEGFNYDRIREGFLLICLGFFKKYVIADNLFQIVGQVYSEPNTYSGGVIYLATVLARYQIFADFSAYTEIAIGTGIMFGIRLSENFNRPFASISIADHWRRWHMTLSNWMRDYVFYPLISSPFSKLGMGGNIFLVFVLLGLWHGNTVNFLLLGVSQGLMMVMNHYLEKKRGRVLKFLNIPEKSRLLNWVEMLWTFLVIVALPTVFFKAKDFDTSRMIFNKIFTGTYGFQDLNHFSSYIPILGILFFYELLCFVNTKHSLKSWLKNQNIFVRWLLYIIILGVFIMNGKFEEPVDFAYRNF